MRIPTTYEAALARYPEQVTCILAKLLKGKSRERNARPEDLEWSYRTAVTVQAYSLSEVFAGLARSDALRQDLTVEQMVQDEVNRTSTALEARRGRWSYDVLVENPPEIAQSARTRIERQRRERDEFNALPQAEQDRRTQELLERLGQDPGFVKLTLGREPG